MATAAKVLIWGAVGLLLYTAHVAFIPIALALLLALILSGPVEALHRLRVPRAASALLMLVITVGLLVGAVELLWMPAQEWFDGAPKTLQTIKRRVMPIVRFKQHVDDLRGDASAVSDGKPASASPPVVVAPPAEDAVGFLDGTREVLVAFVTVVVVTLFLLAGGPPMMARMTAAFGDNLRAGRVLFLIERVRAEVGRFYLTTTFINLGLGCATTIVMLAWGMPTPYLWGALAAAFNYIPYLGSATTLAIVTVVAMVSFTDLTHILGVAGSYLALATVEGQVVQPLCVGRRLDVNPLIVFLALWFGGLFWGIPGILLATPILVTLKVLAEHSEGGKPLLEFLNPNAGRPVTREAR
ncbi:MAG: AI-2E family transporter [Gammaproteobacteria bacterium]